MGDSVVLYANRTRIVDLAQRHRLPAMYPNREYVDAGGLMWYGVSWRAVFLRAAVYVDKILKAPSPPTCLWSSPRSWSWSST